LYYASRFKRFVHFIQGCGFDAGKHQHSFNQAEADKDLISSEIFESNLNDATEISYSERRKVKPYQL
jgi:hypothetical protein